jgi:hypothetical protein
MGSGESQLTLRRKKDTDRALLAAGFMLVSLYTEDEGDMFLSSLC